MPIILLGAACSSGVVNNNTLAPGNSTGTTTPLKVLSQDSTTKVPEQLTYTPFTIKELGISLSYPKGDASLTPNPDGSYTLYESSRPKYKILANFQRITNSSEISSSYSGPYHYDLATDTWRNPEAATAGNQYDLGSGPLVPKPKEPTQLNWSELPAYLTTIKSAYPALMTDSGIKANTTYLGYLLFSPDHIRMVEIYPQIEFAAEPNTPDFINAKDVLAAITKTVTFGDVPKDGVK